FNTSADAFKNSKRLQALLGLPYNHQIARLAIGRSMGEPSAPLKPLDAQGSPIKGHNLFSDESLTLWTTLIVQAWHEHTDKDNITIDEFQEEIRAHWHRGIYLLMDDWKEAGEDYYKFIEILINRRAMLGGETSAENDIEDGESSPKEPPIDRSAELLKALKEVGITSAKISGFKHGPRISIYDVFLDVNHLAKLKQSATQLDFVLSVKSISVSQADTPNNVAVHIPRDPKTWETITGSAIKSWVEQYGKDYQLPLALGVTTEGEPYCFDLAAAPHVFTTGTTGSGKSVTLHAAILSLLYEQEDVQFLLIDPKRVELSAYAKLPNLRAGRILNDPDESQDALDEIIQEIDNRNRSFAAINAQNITDAHKKGEIIPYIVVIIDELADLILQSSTIEDKFIRIAQLGRSAGIHLILSTQRPDAKTFDGLLRSNIPARIALSVQKSTESKIILDDTGAETLLGFGDMLIRSTAGSVPVRIHGAYVKSSDIVACIRSITQ
ncbi:MAG: hypothetical protein HQK96_20265, partial [Nitrospirae bacterium]|nr:hypothetical protein [Nitrospirota bacterium]